MTDAMRAELLASAKRKRAAAYAMCETIPPGAKLDAACEGIKVTYALTVAEYRVLFEDDTRLVGWGDTREKSPR